MAFVEQPKTVFGMGMSGVTTPPGLDYLAQVDELLVEQRIDIAEVLTGFEIANKYAILNKAGQQCYFAQEESDCCHRQMCGMNRGYLFHVVDNNNQEVMRFQREFKCCAGCCWCADGSCGWEMSVEAPVGSVIGYVRQQTSGCKPRYFIYDANHTKLQELWGPCCLIQSVCCQDDLNFKVYTADMSTQICRVWKQYDTCVRDCFTNADTYGVQFPMDMDVKNKALLMASTILIDFMFFEYQGNGGGGGS